MTERYVPAILPSFLLSLRPSPSPSSLHLTGKHAAFSFSLSSISLSLPSPLSPADDRHMGHPRYRSARRAVVGCYAGGRRKREGKEGEDHQEASKGGELSGRGEALAVAEERKGRIRGNTGNLIPAIGPYRGSVISRLLLLPTSTSILTPLPFSSPPYSRAP